MIRGTLTFAAVLSGLFCVLLGMDHEWTGAMCMMFASAASSGFAAGVSK
jgi:hypothetical protein